jgi:hypothetical protein
VTLADKDVQKALAARFVCAWQDTSGDPEAGASFAHDPKEPATDLLRGNGEHNLQVLFLTPKGEIFHAVAGYASPKDFLDEIAFAEKVWRGLAVPGVDRKALVTTMQRAAAADARKLPNPFGEDVPCSPTQSVVQAREFVAKNPLMPAARFRPSQMFGSGIGSFFGSTSGSPEGKPQIGVPLGDQTARSIDEILAKVREAVRKALEEPAPEPRPSTP